MLETNIGSAQTKLISKVDSTNSDPVKVQTGSVTEEDAVELLGSWNLMAIYAIPEVSGLEITSENVSIAMGLSIVEAESAINRLIYLGALVETEVAGVYATQKLYFDETVVSSSDLLGSFLKISEQTKNKMTSKDTFGGVFNSMNKKIILKYMKDIYAIIDKITIESKGLSDNEVFAFQYSFVKATRIKKGK